MRNYREVENLYDQLEAILSTLQLGDVSSDHRAELEGFRGWNYVAISAVAKQATRSLIYVYDDVDPSQKAFRKSMRLTHGSQWRKAVVREHQGQILDSLHPLVRLLHRPNPYQSGGSFRWEQLQQLRLHGSCIVFNRPNISRTRTVQRYVVPLALITPIKPSIARGMPRGGITIHPSSATVPSEAMLANGWGSGLQQFFGVEIPVEMLTIIKYPHPYLRGDGASPTGAASHWIDAGSMIDASRAKFYAEGPNGKMLISADVDSPSQVQELEERLSRRLAEDGPRVTIIGNGATIATKRTADEMAYDVGHDQMRDAVLAS
ncbi:MAG: phage portal protein, partial [Pirellula sp.]